MSQSKSNIVHQICYRRYHQKINHDISVFADVRMTSMLTGMCLYFDSKGKNRLGLQFIGAVFRLIEPTAEAHEVQHVQVGACRVGLLSQRQDLVHQHAERPATSHNLIHQHAERPATSHNLIPVHQHAERPATSHNLIHQHTERSIN